MISISTRIKYTLSFLPLSFPSSSCTAPSIPPPDLLHVERYELLIENIPRLKPLSIPVNELHCSQQKSVIIQLEKVRNIIDYLFSAILSPSLPPSSHSPTHSLLHSIQLLTCLFTLSLTLSLIRPFAHPLAHSLTLYFTHTPSHSLTQSLTHLFTQ